MRKPQPVKGQHIPRNTKPYSQNNMSDNLSKIDVAGMLDKLDKLDGDQITQLGNGVIELANNGMELAKEYLKTGQVLAQSQVEIRKSEAEVKKVFIQEETKQKEIAQRGKDNELNYYLDTNKEANSHDQILKILDLVENGKISSEQLSELVSSVKSMA